MASKAIYLAEDKKNFIPVSGGAVWFLITIFKVIVIKEYGYVTKNKF